MLMDHHTAFLTGRMTRQEHGNAVADGVFHPRSGALVAQKAGRLADRVLDKMNYFVELPGKQDGEEQGESPAHIAQLLNVSRRTLYRAIKYGVTP